MRIKYICLNRGCEEYKTIWYLENNTLPIINCPFCLENQIKEIDK